MLDGALIKRATLIVVTMTSFMTPFMSSSVTLALPAMGNELSMNAKLLSWIATANLLASAVFLVPFGRIADIKGRKRIYLYGIEIFTISSLLLGLSPSAFWLILFRILQGIGAAMIFGTGIALISSVYEAEDRGKALGLNAAAVYTGLSLGPFLGGFLTEHFGWRSVFFANVFLGIIVIVIVLTKLKEEWIADLGEKIDYIGSTIYGVALICLIYGLSTITKMSGFYIFLIGILGSFIFIKWEFKTISPLVNINLFKESKAFTYSNIAALINYSATFSVTFLLSIFIQYIKGLSPSSTGTILLVQPLTMAILSPFSGWLSDKVEPCIISSIGMLLSGFALAAFSFINFDTSIRYFVFALVLLGFGLALFASPNTNAIMSSVSKNYYGLASSMLGTMRLVGQALSMAITTLIISFFLGNAKISPLNYVLLIKSTHASFIFFSLLCIIGVFASLNRGKIRNK